MGLFNNNKSIDPNRRGLLDRIMNPNPNGPGLLQRIANPNSDPNNGLVDKLFGSLRRKNTSNTTPNTTSETFRSDDQPPTYPKNGGNASW